MNCDDIDNAIYVFLDDEFADLERVDFEAHLRGCQRCRALVERESRFVGAVRDSAPRVDAPAALRDRIRLALDEAPAPLPADAIEPAVRHLRLAPALALAAAALLAALVWRPWAAPPPEAAATLADPVVFESVEAHQDDPPMDVRGSERQVRDFLQDNVGFAVEVPFEDRAGVSLLGGRLTRVGGRKAVQFNYDVDGERLTVIQVADGPAVQAPDLAPSVHSRQGFDVVTYRRHGVTSSVVGSASSPSVRKLVRAAYRR